MIFQQSDNRRRTLAQLSTPAKALATCVIVTLAFGMLGALGQVYIHDIIPTFFSGGRGGVPDSAMETNLPEKAGGMASAEAADRGDLFSDLSPVAVEPEDKPLYENEQFVWTLRWTHIHLFGMNTIFILMGAVALLLDISSRWRTWLVVLPFVGVMIDIAAMWLKAFVSPVFFWLHVPGGGIFAGIFAFVCLRSLWEMWITGRDRQRKTCPAPCKASAGRSYCLELTEAAVRGD